MDITIIGTGNMAAIGGTAGDHATSDRVGPNSRSLAEWPASGAAPKGGDYSVELELVATGSRGAS